MTFISLKIRGFSKQFVSQSSCRSNSVLTDVSFKKSSLRILYIQQGLKKKKKLLLESTGPSPASLADKRDYFCCFFFNNVPQLKHGFKLNLSQREEKFVKDKGYPQNETLQNGMLECFRLPIFRLSRAGITESVICYATRLNIFVLVVGVGSLERVDHVRKTGKK